MEITQNDLVERVTAAIRDNIEGALPPGVAVDYGYAAHAAIKAVRQHLVPRDAAVSRQFAREFEALMEAAL